MLKRLTILLAALVVIPGVQAEQEFEAAVGAVKSMVPNVQIDSVRPAPFPGFVEMLLGAQLIYVSNDGRYLIDGQLIEIASRKNLSELSKGAVRKERLEQLAMTDQVAFPADGEKKHTITVFTDIDCAYCRRLHAQIDEYNGLGIDVNYLFFPRAGVGSHSFEKAVSVWCAEDRNSAFTAAKAGEEPVPLDCPNPVERHFELGRELGVTGTPALVAEDGTLIPGYVPPATLIVRLDALAVTTD
jgi:thiol:disulfide interchange protein DsbC